MPKLFVSKSFLEFSSRIIQHLIFKQINLIVIPGRTGFGKTPFKKRRDSLLFLG
ncbi:hypothetical protein VCRA2120O389_390020 [Vibrio crassostreae]|nr:hypothetical protein VCRA2113O356_300042 [Vibrio crassostreae]CAK2112642.1 hypothetical protein VCRA2117O378_420034 [Vibrio crassostreae]CAK2369084.1 hypothetical protein VCRA2116O372_440007 [Vibrio crassostreae]CAK2370441.1 hypothetical protein VCRA2119O386_480021 [Vibrio crassostreae]CAK2511096.1 hypothetical protein VCRA2113O364_420008 [Vibrio crassostreae]